MNDIPVFLWFVFAVILGCLWLFFYAFGDAKRFGSLWLALGAVSAFSGFICFVIGCIRFIKWAWVG